MTSTRDPTIQNFRRYEFKYIVDNSRAELIRQDLLEFLEVDPLLKQSGNQSYTVRSLYFDSSTREHFYEKIDGVKSRKKYRLRAYSSKSSEARSFFLEQKGKHNERTFKKRASFDISVLENFSTDNGIRWLMNNYPDDKFLSEYLFDVTRLRLKPVVLVEYQRRRVLKRPRQDALTKLRHLFAIAQHDRVLADEIDAADVAVQVDPDARPVESCSDLFDMGRLSCPVVALNHDTPVVSEASQNCYRRLAIEAIGLVDIRHMLFCLAESWDFHIAFDAEDLTNGNSNVRLLIGGNSGGRCCGSHMVGSSQCS